MSTTGSLSQKDDQGDLSIAESGDETSHLADEGGASNRGGPSHGRSKRVRTVTSKSNDPHKKYVKGRQGALQGIKKMPIEVFTEIAYHITPADLITLIRTNKFFRTILLRRSSIRIWQRAQANIPELPPCPTGMSEPQYAALMFSKFCTLCGASALKADPWLRVRLCASCRETKLQEITQEVPEFNFVATSYYTNLAWPFGRQVICCLQEELEQVNRLCHEFQQKGDHSGLREWEQERCNKMVTQEKEAAQLFMYIDSVAQSRADELEDLKAERREQVYQRLKALGWDEKYLDFWDGPERKWNSLVDVPKPLTERIWKNLLPKLTPLLEENRSRIDEEERQPRRLVRLEKVQQLMRQFKSDTHPYQAIVNALGLTIPADGAPYILREVLHIPFPRIDTAVNWDFIKDIYEEENSLERVEELFNQRREQLGEKVLKWREEIEEQLVKQYMGDGDGVETDKFDPIVLVQGSSQATKHLSPSARFLLRADTVFSCETLRKTSPPEGETYLWEGHARHYPCMVFAFTDHPTFTGLADLDNYIRYAGMERIVKILLRDMGMPDVAHIELNSKRDVLACGRCYRIRPVTWKDLISHYLSLQWVGGKDKGGRYSTRHPITIRDMHYLKSEPDPKPLVRMLSDDASETARNNILSRKAWVWCLICCGVGLDHTAPCDSLELMQEHMHEIHYITGKLVKGLHYTKCYGLPKMRPGGNLVAQWQKNWDAYYDAQQKGDTIESEPQAGSPGVTETASGQP